MQTVRRVLIFGGALLVIGMIFFADALVLWFLAADANEFNKTSVILEFVAAHGMVCVGCACVRFTTLAKRGHHQAVKNIIELSLLVASVLGCIFPLLNKMTIRCVELILTLILTLI